MNAHTTVQLAISCILLINFRRKKQRMDRFNSNVWSKTDKHWRFLFCFALCPSLPLTLTLKLYSIFKNNNDKKNNQTKKRQTDDYCTHRNLECIRTSSLHTLSKYWRGHICCVSNRIISINPLNYFVKTKKKKSKPEMITVCSAFRPMWAIVWE